MGILGGLIVYGFGKRRGRRKAERDFAKIMAEAPHPDVYRMSEECSNYATFCEAYGSCDGMACEYD